MNCEECQEQIFELIEREAVDPDGVREILMRCPDCRAAFDEMKAALAAAEQLPIEEPSVALDAAIVRAAAARTRQPVPSRKKRLQPPLWAAAALVLLAVGVGMWVIPRAAPPEGEAAPAEMKRPEYTMAAERMAPKRKALPQGAAPAKRRPRSHAEGAARAAQTVQAPASRGAADLAAGAVAASPPAEAQPTASRALKEVPADGLVARCKRKVAGIERRTRMDEEYVPKPEEELAIGQCYQALGKVDEARRWLRLAATHRETKARAEEALRDLRPK